MPQVPSHTVAGLDLIVTPSDVAAKVAKVDNDIATLQASVDGATFAPDQTVAWNGLKAEWAAWKTANPSVSWLPISYLQQNHEVVDFEMRLREWEPVIRQAHGGTLAGPSIQPSGGGGLGGLGDSLTTGVEIGAGAALLAGLIGLAVFAMVKK
jgi:hypothetical protein